MVDGMATHLPHSHFHQAKPTGSAAESLTEQAVLSYLSALEPNGSLHVEYDEPTLHWMLEQARRRRAAGALHAAIVKTDRRIIGWYLYHLDRDRLANVLHIAAERPSAREVLDHLFYQAAAQVRLPQPAGWNRSICRRCPTPIACSTGAVPGYSSTPASQISFDRSRPTTPCFHASTANGVSGTA